MKAFNVYQINIIETLKFMHKTKYGINPRILLNNYRVVEQQIPTKYSQNSFYYKNLLLKSPALQ